MVERSPGLLVVIATFLLGSFLVFGSAVPTAAADGNEPPTARIDDITFPARANRTLTFEGAGSDTDGSIVRYEWDFDGDGTYDWNSTENGITTHSFTLPGNYTPSFKVKDDGGNWSVEANVSLTVRASEETSGGNGGDGNGTEEPLLPSYLSWAIMGFLALILVVSVARAAMARRAPKVSVPQGIQTSTEEFQCAVCGVDTQPGERTCTVCGAIHPKVWRPVDAEPGAATARKPKPEKPARKSRFAARRQAKAKAALDAVRSGPPNYIVEEIFHIHHDGRVMNHIGQVDSGTDFDLVGGMFSAIMDFVKDSFGRPGFLGAIEYGDNKILIEMGRYSFLVVVVYGDTPQKLREHTNEALTRTETYLTGVIEQWNGDRELMTPAREFIAPLVMETAGVTRKQVEAALADEGVKLVSAWEYYQGCIRLKVACVNHTSTVVTDLKVDIDYDRHLLRWDHHEPDFHREGSVIHMGIIEGGGKKTVAVAFDPLMCQRTSLNALASFKDARGELNTATMKRRLVEVVCPLFFTPDNASTATLRRLVEDKLTYKDSKLYRIPDRMKPAKALDMAKQTLEGRDVKFVKQYIQPEPFKAEAWYYGVTKVKKEEMVVRVGIDEQAGLISLFAAANQSASLVGLLAELGHDMVKLAARQGVTLKSVTDQLVKDELLNAS